MHRNGSGSSAPDDAVEARTQQLASMPLLLGVPLEHVRLLAAVAEVVCFEPADRIVTQGEPGESVNLILDGRVEALARISVRDVVSDWDRGRRCAGAGQRAGRGGRGDVPRQER